MFITVSLLAYSIIVTYRLKFKSYQVAEQLIKDRTYLIDNNMDHLNSDPLLDELEDLSAMDRKRISKDQRNNNLKSVLRYFERYGIELPTHIIIDMLRIESIQTKKDIFNYLNTMRKNYARDLNKTIPTTKEALKALED